MIRKTWVMSHRADRIPYLALAHQTNSSLDLLLFARVVCGTCMPRVYALHRFTEVV